VGTERTGNRGQHEHEPERGDGAGGEVPPGWLGRGRR
jgi:hypothetical protein